VGSKAQAKRRKQLTRRTGTNLISEESQTIPGEGRLTYEKKILALLSFPILGKRWTPRNERKKKKARNMIQCCEKTTTSLAKNVGGGWGIRERARSVRGSPGRFLVKKWTLRLGHVQPPRTLRGGSHRLREKKPVDCRKAIPHMSSIGGGKGSGCFCETYKGGETLFLKEGLDAPMSPIRKRHRSANCWGSKGPTRFFHQGKVEGERQTGSP